MSLFSSLPLGQFTETAISSKTSTVSGCCKDRFSFSQGSAFTPAQNTVTNHGVTRFLRKIPKKNPVGCKHKHFRFSQVPSHIHVYSRFARTATQISLLSPGLL